MEPDTRLSCTNRTGAFDAKAEACSQARHTGQAGNRDANYVEMQPGQLRKRRKPKA